jgi:hypothetical protein
MTRNEANMQIILLLSNYLQMYPETRFHQALFNLGINEFSEGTKNEMVKMDFDGRNTTLKDKYIEESITTYLKLQQI